jgi:hypothetical protein
MLPMLPTDWIAASRSAAGTTFPEIRKGGGALAHLRRGAAANSRGSGVRRGGKARRVRLLLRSAPLPADSRDRAGAGCPAGAAAKNLRSRCGLAVAAAAWATFASGTPGRRVREEPWAGTRRGGSSRPSGSAANPPEAASELRRRERDAVVAAYAVNELRRRGGGSSRLSSLAAGRGACPRYRAPGPQDLAVVARVAGKIPRGVGPRGRVALRGPAPALLSTSRPSFGAGSPGADRPVSLPAGEGPGARSVVTSGMAKKGPPAGAQAVLRAISLLKAFPRTARTRHRELATKRA